MSRRVSPCTLKYMLLLNVISLAVIQMRIEFRHVSRRRVRDWRFIVVAKHELSGACAVTLAARAVTIGDPYRFYI